MYSFTTKSPNKTFHFRHFYIFIMQYTFKILNFLLLSVLFFVGCVTINEGPKVKPVPNFSINNDNCHAACTISFQNTTIGEKVQYQWDFGDGGTSTEENPAHEYAQMGTYQVKLTAQNTGGAESVVKPVTIAAPTLPNKCSIKSVSITQQSVFNIGTWDLTDYPDIYIRTLDDLGNTYTRTQTYSNESGTNLPLLINNFFTDLNFPDNSQTYMLRLYDDDGATSEIMKEFSFKPADYLPIAGQYTTQFTLTDADITMVVVLEWTE